MGTALASDHGTTALLSPDELADAIAAVELESARLALMLRRLELSGDLEVASALRPSAWLQHRGRMSRRQAARWLALGRFLHRFPAIADAQLEGRISAGQVDILRAHVSDRTAPLLEDHQSAVVDAVAPLDAAATERVASEWAHRAEALLDDIAPRSDADRALSFARAGDGAVLGRFTLVGAAAAEFEAAIRTASTFEGGADVRSASQRRADALHDIAAHFNRTHDTPSGTRRHPHVELGISSDELTRHRVHGLDPHTGHVADAATTETVLCDCVVHPVARDQQWLPLAYGRARYTVPRHLFRLVATRDGGCRFPGCHRSLGQCDAHHLRHWRHGGTTDPDNLMLLCNRHHHLVHRQHVVTSLDDDGTVHFVWPDGARQTTAPGGRPPPAISPPV